MHNQHDKDDTFAGSPVPYRRWINPICPDLYLIFLPLLMAFACQQPTQEEPTAALSVASDTARLNVAFLVYDQVEALDLSGALDVFTKANRISEPAFTIYTVGESQEPLATEGGSLRLIPTYRLADAPSADILIIPGATTAVIDEMMSHEALMAWVKQQASGSQRTMSVCTGAFLLAKTGLLDGQPATTHHGAIVALKEQFPALDVVENQRFAVAGKYLTTAGISSGIDGALQLVEELHGKSAADLIANILVYPRQATLNFLSDETDTTHHPEAASVSSTSLDVAVDPVCRMHLTGPVSDTVHYRGKVIGFCMGRCRAAFEEDPEHYLTNLNP